MRLALVSECAAQPGDNNKSINLVGTMSMVGYWSLSSKIGLFRHTLVCLRGTMIWCNKKRRRCVTPTPDILPSISTLCPVPWQTTSPLGGSSEQINAVLGGLIPVSFRRDSKARSTVWASALQSRREIPRSLTRSNRSSRFS